MKRFRLRALLGAAESSGVRQIVWTHDPRLLRLLSGDQRKPLTVCDIIDDHRLQPTFNARSKAEYKLCYQELPDFADVVFTVGKPTAEEFARNGANSHWVPNGVEWQRFHDTIADPPPEPEELAALPRPRVAFLGILSSRTDHSLLNRVAGALTRGSVVFIGKWLGPTQPLDERITSIGFKPASDVHRYLAWVDIGLVIYVSDELSQSGDATKIYEYLAAGKPVVTTAFQDRERIPACVHYETDTDSFVRRVIALCNDCERQTGHDLAVARSEDVRYADWRLRVQRMLEIVAQAHIEIHP